MRFFKVSAYLFALASALSSFAQKGPGGVGNTDGLTTLHMWWRADSGIAPPGGPVSNWSDQSGYGNTLSQAAGGSQPTVAVSAALNNQTIVRYGGAQFFSSAFLGPGVDNMTIFVVANGTSYQSLFRFQNTSGNFLVYPWEFGGGRTFISSSDGGTGSGLESGLVNSVNNVGAARYRRNVATSGMQTYLNGGVFLQRTSGNSVLPTEPFFSGTYNPGASEFPTCDVGEMMIFYSALNDAQMVIVQNYLAAKYNVTLTSNDVYTMDNPGNGNYDFDVAGIGRSDAANVHNDSQGTGFVRILNPTDLGDGEYFAWGHNNLVAQANNTTDIPAGYGLTGRFDRVWRVSETGEVGNIDLHFDVTGLSDFSSLSACDASTAIRLLVDTNNDGNFADQTPLSGATNIGGNVYRFANIGAINNNYRFTLAIVTSSVGGPGGVGGTNGTTNLKLWMDAGKGVTSSSGAVTSWVDQSGSGITCTPPTVGSRPTFVGNTLNAQPVISFNSAASNFLELSSNINTLVPTTFIVANKASAGTGYMTILTLQQNLWLVQGNSVDQWGMYLNGDFLSGVTLNNTYRLMTTLERNFNDVDLYTNETLLNVSGAGYHGKAINTIGSNNNGLTNTALQFYNGSIAEIAVFNKVLNTAQRIIVDNYLAAKYGLPLSANDVYTRDDNANGDFDFEVAGIGRVNATNLHDDAKGTGVVRISNPSSLGDGDYMMWGHNNGTLIASTADVPAGVQARFNRVWSVSEVGEVGNIDIQFDLTGQSPVTASDLRLLIDDDGDGIFNEGSTFVISGATALSCNNYLFGAVTSVLLGNGMRFTLGTVNKIQTPLPIELISFQGTINKHNASELTWATATEHNNDYFTVERSLDGEKFSSVTKVAGAGQSTTRKDYSAIDEFPPVGRLYYRLKQTDYDGGFTHSKIISLTNSPSESKILVSPNPVRIGEDINVRIVNPEKPVTDIIFVLYDLLGRTITPGFETDGDNNFKIKTGGIRASGLYILKVRSLNGNKDFFQRIYLSE